MAHARRLTWPRMLPLVAVAGALSGCPLGSFEVETGSGTIPASGGGGASGGRGSGGGLSTSGDGGMSARPPPPQAHPDRFFLQQGSGALQVRGPGVLANDSPRGAEVASSEPLTDLPDELMPDWELAPDGSFRFTPKPGFFGLFELAYAVKNRDDETAESTIRVHVLPTDIDLSLLEDGVGGLVLDGGRGDRLGSSLHAAGDVNDDGIDDLLVGAPTADAGAGATFVVYGGRDLGERNLSSSPAPDQAALYTVFNGEEPDQALGTSVGTLRARDGSTRALLFGSVGGFGRIEVLELAEPTEEPSVVNVVARVAVTGDEREGGLGALVDCAGDLDGDGSPDLLVASRRGERGVLRVVPGSELGEVALADVDGPELVASAEGDGFPLSFAGIGDVDADGADEVLTASAQSFLLLLGGRDYPDDEREVSIDGSAHGYRAQRAAPATPASVAALGDIDADGLPDLGYCDGTLGCRVVRSPISTLVNGVRVFGFGASATRVGVSTAGDFDGDGVRDLMFSEDAAAYVVYGRRAAQPDVNVTQLSGVGFRLRMPEGGVLSAIASAGDFNDDGIDDLAIADATFGSRAGRVYVVFGVASR